MNAKPRARRPPGGRAMMPEALREFLHTEAGGGAVLAVAAVAALVWANSPWQGAYATLWETKLTISVGDLSRSEDLRHLVNDALMALFFLVIGLEIKRELVVGELSRWRDAAIPVLAAFGGTLVPAAIYVAINNGQPGAEGWGIPMATDIAFALGVVALLGRRIPSTLRIFLLTLAIVDDIIAILVIAVFYSSGIAWPALAAAGVLVTGIVVLRTMKVSLLAPYAILGVGVWIAFYESGVHATLAGVVLGLLAPATAAAERLQHQLHPFTSFAVIPIFALANAGVVFTADALDAPGAGAVALGVGAGLVIGKVLGVVGFTWLAVRLGLGSLPRASTWPQVVGIAALAGIGFTVSLFISGLAFPGSPLESAAKIGILGASFVAAALGALILTLAHRGAPTSA